MSQLSTPEVDALIAELQVAAVGSPERSEVLSELETRVLEDEVAVVPIYHAANLYATSSSVSGFHTTPN